MYAYMSTGHGFVEASSSSTIYRYTTRLFDELRDQMGLLAEQTMTWDEALNRLPLMDRTYISAALRRGERSIGGRGTSTIHGAKGGEADNVALFTDCPLHPTVHA